MNLQISVGRVLGLFSCGVLFCIVSSLAFAGGAGASQVDEVAIEYKANGVAEFRLADYQNELIECSALSAIHMWIGDNIGDDLGSEVRRTIAEDYWLETSKDYLALASQASGKQDLSAEFRTEIKSLAAEWRRLTQSDTAPEQWTGWYELVDRCDAWRPEKTVHSFYSRGKAPVVGQDPMGTAVVGAR